MSIRWWTSPNVRKSSERWLPMVTIPASTVADSMVRPQLWRPWQCSKDNVIQNLVDKNILIEDIPGVKQPSYSAIYAAEDLTQFFTEVCIVEENEVIYLKA